MSHLRFCRASFMHDSDARQSRVENESRDCATRHDATCDTPRHTWEFDERPRVARLCHRCDIGLRVYHAE